MATRKIKFIHRYRGWRNANPYGKDAPNGHQPGDIVECEEKRAKWFVEDSKVQWAIYVGEKEVETAAVEPKAERAVTDAAKAKPRKATYQSPKVHRSKIDKGPGPKEGDDVNIQ